MIASMTEARIRNTANGHYFFDKESVKFFHSRFSKTVVAVPNGALFVSSECQGKGWQRLYTVRFIEDCGRVETVGEFQGFRSSADAWARLRELVSTWTYETIVIGGDAI